MHTEHTLDGLLIRATDTAGRPVNVELRLERADGRSAGRIRLPRTSNGFIPRIVRGFDGTTIDPILYIGGEHVGSVTTAGEFCVNVLRVRDATSRFDGAEVVL